MKTYSTNALALELEIDRGTMLRALRDVEPDAGVGTNRPTFKIVTAVRAMAEHRAKNQRADCRENYKGFRGNGTQQHDNKDWRDAVLVELFRQEDQALAYMCSHPTLEGRRKAAKSMLPLLGKINRAVTERGMINGFDQELCYYRANDIYRVGLRNFEEPCAWSELETREAMALEGAQ
jgi:hypothetical protein